MLNNLGLSSVKMCTVLPYFAGEQGYSQKSPVTVGLGIMTFAVTRRTAFLLTMADALFALLRGSTDRGAVTGKSQVPGIKKPPVDGLVQELLVIKPENEEKGILRL